MSESQVTFVRNVRIPAEAIATTTLATLAVLLRFFSRWMKGLRYKRDDWMLATSMIFLFALLFLLLMLVFYGLGIPSTSLSPEVLVTHKKTLLAFECVYITTIAFVKIAFLLMYVRAFDNHSMRVSCLVLGSMILTWSIAVMAATIFQCAPISKAWNSDQEGTCISLKSVMMANAIPNVLTDICLLILPLRQVWRLVPTIQLRLQLLVVFSLGVLVVFASVFRFTTLFDFDPKDITYTLAAANVWCNIECCCGVISVCLPTLGPLIQWLFRRKIFGYQPISTVASVMKTNHGSRSSHFLHKINHNRRESKSQPYDKLELRPFDLGSSTAETPIGTGIGTGKEWLMPLFGRRKSQTDEPSSTWVALNLDMATLKRPREHRSISEPLEFPSLVHSARWEPRTAGRGA